jgi:hypothetical protein
VLQQVIAEAESRTTNLMVISFSNCNINMSSKFEGMRNHVQELLKKLIQQECMISSLLTESNQQKVDQIILETVETICVKMREEVSFIKTS